MNCADLSIQRRNMKDRKEILKQPLVNISDIKALLGVPRDRAKELYEICDLEENGKPFRAHERKVPLQSVLKKAGISYSFLQKQIG